MSYYLTVLIFKGRNSLPKIKLESVNFFIKNKSQKLHLTNNELEDHFKLFS